MKITSVTMQSARLGSTSSHASVTKTNPVVGEASYKITRPFAVGEQVTLAQSELDELFKFVGATS